MAQLHENNQLANEQLVDAEIDIQTPKQGNCHWYGSDKNRVILAYVTAKAWEDTAYKAALLANPKLILQEEGMEGIPTTLQIQVLENTATRKYVLLENPAYPLAPAQNRLADVPQQQSPKGIELVVVQNTDEMLYLLLSDKPNAFMTAFSPKGTQDMTFFGPANSDIAVNVEAAANAVASVNAVAASNVAAVAFAVAVLI